MCRRRYRHVGRGEETVRDVKRPAFKKGAPEQNEAPTLAYLPTAIKKRISRRDNELKNSQFLKSTI
jgi:hypothetical protein